ncbi:hypothetical protein HK099_007575 [Clydaea vesicula]|uniref:Uncharacterized protein n=1 Tax=Clydaea vesicula TaxID=447962 RepID=A0AAD5XWB3_9FUNG|nr:hypothetical protein HK099_007575 [Clydaea vesicula]
MDGAPCKINSDCGKEEYYCTDLLKCDFKAIRNLESHQIVVVTKQVTLTPTVHQVLNSTSTSVASVEKINATESNLTLSNTMVTPINFTATYTATTNINQTLFTSPPSLSSNVENINSTSSSEYQTSNNGGLSLDSGIVLSGLIVLFFSLLLSLYLFFKIKSKKLYAPQRQGVKNIHDDDNLFLVRKLSCGTTSGYSLSPSISENVAQTYGNRFSLSRVILDNNETIKRDTQRDLVQVVKKKQTLQEDPDLTIHVECNVDNTHFL